MSFSSTAMERYQNPALRNLWKRHPTVTSVVASASEKAIFLMPCRPFQVQSASSEPNA